MAENNFGCPIGPKTFPLPSPLPSVLQNAFQDVIEKVEGMKPFSILRAVLGSHFFFFFFSFFVLQLYAALPMFLLCP